MNIGISDLDYTMDFIRRMLPILIPLVILSWTLMITGIVSLVKKPNTWNEKILWLLIIIFISTFGPVIYFALGSGMLDEKWVREQDQRDQTRGDQYPGGLS